jgi:hypothetical protein
MSKIIGASPLFFVRNLPPRWITTTRFSDSRDPRCGGIRRTSPSPSVTGFSVMLSEAEGVEIAPNGRLDQWDAYFRCSGLEELYHELEANGANIVHAPVDRPLYGMREFAVKDIDGYMLAFAEDAGA